MNRQDLRADCARCFGLCCVAPAFAASADFAIDKRLVSPCPHLAASFRCGIHDELRPRGFRGCGVYDCFGAGQRVAQQTFGGRDWRQAPETAAPMFAAFRAVRPLHELLWYLAEAGQLPAAAALHPQLRQAADRIEHLAAAPAEELARLDVAAVRAPAAALLARASALARAGYLREHAVPRRGPRIRPGADLAGADLMGRSLARADLRAATLRGAVLIAARLPGADLRGADLLGADLRDTDLRGARLDATLFLTQSQLEAAVGDQATTLSARRTRPAHWR